MYVSVLSKEAREQDTQLHYCTLYLCILELELTVGQAAIISASYSKEDI